MDFTLSNNGIDMVGCLLNGFRRKSTEIFPLLTIVWKFVPTLRHFHSHSGVTKRTELPYDRPSESPNPT